MSIQAKAFQFSLLIHGTLLAGLVLAGLLLSVTQLVLVTAASLQSRLLATKVAGRVQETVVLEGFPQPSPSLSLYHVAGDVSVTFAKPQLPLLEAQIFCPLT